MDFSSLPDRNLIAECLKDDPAAWEALLERHKRVIYSITVRFGFDVDDRHEVFQTVCVEILRSLASLREVATLRHWIVTITIRQCNDSLRRKYRDRAVQSYDEGSVSEPAIDTLQIYAAAEREEWLRLTMQQLSARCRKLIERLFLQDDRSSYEEMAEELGLSRDSIGSVRQRCLEQLRKLLEDRGESK
jgi:RNA polymerase sigma factor (sigma-70 family)